MQLHARLGVPAQKSSDGIERNAEIAENRNLMQLVQRSIHPARDEPLYEQASADESPHQRAYGGQLAKRDEGAQIAEMEFRQRLAVEACLDRLDQQHRLLSRRLCARRYERA